MKLSTLETKLIFRKAYGQTFERACKEEGIQRTKAYRIINNTMQANGIKNMQQLITIARQNKLFA